MRIGLTLSVLGLAMSGLGAMVVTTVPAAAQQCKSEAVTATSREYVSRSLGAFPGSWAAWRKAVVDQHGSGWQAWRRAQDRKIQCEQATNSEGRKRWTCTRTAIPCQSQLAANNPGKPNTPEYNYEPIDTVLRRGMSGEQVKTLQYLLKEAGYDVTIDGDFGRTTEKALIDFQKKSRLDVDGRAGPKTVEALTS